MTNAWKKVAFHLLLTVLYGRKYRWCQHLETGKGLKIYGCQQLFDWMRGSWACMLFYACMFPTWPATTAGHSLRVVWAHLPRWASLNPHLPTNEQWPVLPFGWLKGPCVALELNLGCEHRNSLTWGRVRPRFPPRQNLNISGLVTQSQWQQQSQSGFLFSSAFCDQIQGYQNSQEDLGFQGRTWFGLISPARWEKGPPSLCGVIGRSKWNRTGLRLHWCSASKIYLQKG